MKEFISEDLVRHAESTFSIEHQEANLKNRGEISQHELSHLRKLLTLIFEQSSYHNSRIRTNTQVLISKSREVLTQTAPWKNLMLKVRSRLGYEERICTRKVDTIFTHLSNKTQALIDNGMQNISGAAAATSPPPPPGRHQLPSTLCPS